MPGAVIPRVTQMSEDMLSEDMLREDMLSDYMLNRRRAAELHQQAEQARQGRIEQRRQEREEHQRRVVEVAEQPVDKPAKPPVNREVTQALAMALQADGDERISSLRHLRAVALEAGDAGTAAWAKQVIKESRRG
jgi:hypothetical protein